MGGDYYTNKKHRVLQSQFRQAFFTELGSFLDQLLVLVPEEGYDITIYRSAVRNATDPKIQEWFLDGFVDYIIEPYKDKIAAHDTDFFTNNSDELVSIHTNTKYGQEAVDMVNKIKSIWIEGKIEKSQEDWIWTMMDTFRELSLKEKALRKYPA